MQEREKSNSTTTCYICFFCFLCVVERSVPLFLVIVGSFVICLFSSDSWEENEQVSQVDWPLTRHQFVNIIDQQSSSSLSVEKNKFKKHFYFLLRISEERLGSLMLVNRSASWKGHFLSSRENKEKSNFLVLKTRTEKRGENRWRQINKRFDYCR